MRFPIHPWQRSDEDDVERRAAGARPREVREPGHVEKRFVVPLDVTLAGRTVTAEMTLSNRDQMGFRMLVGREALRQGFVVDPSLSYAGGKPRRAVRRKNWGK